MYFIASSEFVVQSVQSRCTMQPGRCVSMNFLESLDTNQMNQSTWWWISPGWLPTQNRKKERTKSEKRAHKIQEASSRTNAKSPITAKERKGRRISKSHQSKLDNKMIGVEQFERIERGYNKTSSTPTQPLQKRSATTRNKLVLLIEKVHSLIDSFCPPQLQEIYYIISKWTKIEKKEHRRKTE